MNPRTWVPALIAAVSYGAFGWWFIDHGAVGYVAFALGALIIAGTCLFPVTDVGPEHMTDEALAAPGVPPPPATPMPDYQQRYRRAFLAQIPRWYNGWVHAAHIIAATLMGMWMFAEIISAPLWWEWAGIPAGLLVFNTAEWAIHRYVTHGKWNPSLKLVRELVRFSRRVHERHHNYFTQDMHFYETHRDWAAMFHGPYTQTIFLLSTLPVIIPAGWALSPNFMWFMAAAITAGYGMIEFFHTFSHADSWFARNCPFVNTARRAHMIHHTIKYKGDVNLNLTFPFADWLTGTSDLNRGLAGTMLNGADTTHVKEEIRTVPWRPLPPRLRGLERFFPART